MFVSMTSRTAAGQLCAKYLFVLVGCVQYKGLPIWSRCNSVSVTSYILLHVQAHNSE